LEKKHKKALAQIDVGEVIIVHEGIGKFVVKGIEIEEPLCSAAFNSLKLVDEGVAPPPEDEIIHQYIAEAGQSIQEVIDAAVEAGHNSMYQAVVVVRPGIYRQNITMHSPGIHLVAEGTVALGMVASEFQSVKILGSLIVDFDKATNPEWLGISTTVQGFWIEPVGNGRAVYLTGNYYTMIDLYGCRIRHGGNGDVPIVVSDNTYPDTLLNLTRCICENAKADKNPVISMCNSIGIYESEVFGGEKTVIRVLNPNEFAGMNCEIDEATRLTGKVELLDGITLNGEDVDG